MNWKIVVVPMVDDSVQSLEDALNELSEEGYLVHSIYHGKLHIYIHAHSTPISENMFPPTDNTPLLGVERTDEDGNPIAQDEPLTS